MRYLTKEEREQAFHDDNKVISAIQAWAKSYLENGPGAVADLCLCEELDGAMALIAQREISTEFDENGDDYEHA